MSSAEKTRRENESRANQRRTVHIEKAQREGARAESAKTGTSYDTLWRPALENVETRNMRMVSSA